MCSAAKTDNHRDGPVTPKRQPVFERPLHVGRPNVGNQEQFQKLVGEMFERNWLTNNGPLVQALERRISDYLGVEHCVAMCNGTIALEIAIRALGLQGEVIVPSYTFIATAHALHWQGITPVFADIDPNTHNLDPDAVRSMITPRTTGIIGVHLWGRAAPVEGLQAVADAHGLQLLFDAAHAFGCSHGGRMIGAFGRAEIFSFHATKFFNTFEGGAIVTQDAKLAETMRYMRNFGFEDFDKVVHPGTNGKMVEVCAAMGLANFERLDLVIEANRANLAAYREALSVLPWLRVIEYDARERNNYQYVVVEVSKDAPLSRDAVVAALVADNVLARKYFWPGCHAMKPFRELFPHAGLLLPHTQQVAERVFILPSGASLPPHAPTAIADIIRRAAHR
ncbi:MAG: DegT/DnrJ/EryC1/StrS family aminotransferase [Polyangiales bacterium]